MTHRYFIHLAYNGTDFHGWQVQENAMTVQESINKALSALLNKEMNIIGCGRTDAGVHASDFFAHFDFDGKFTKEDLNKLTFKLNRFLPDSIVIFEIREVKPEVSARFNAVSRTYKYYVHRRKDPFLNDYSYYVYGDLNIELMNQAAKELIKYKDFTSFSKLHTQTKTNICNISHAEWAQKDHQLVFTITGDRFLRNMVRAIVGTLLDVGKLKISLSNFIQIIESKNRSDAGYSVPGKALFLNEIKYLKSIWK